MFRRKKLGHLLELVGMKNGMAHILVYKRLFTGEGGQRMCDTIQTPEENTRNTATPHADVDDLIFRDEKEWLASDR